MWQQLLQKAIVRGGFGLSHEARYHCHHVPLLGREAEDLGILDDVKAVPVRARAVQVRADLMEHGGGAE